jgi:molybdopterin-guanine dinucleotide biosynthesis protein A
MPDGSIAGVVLTGGRSKRMGGVVKAHKLLSGKPLIQHVIDRIVPQVSQLVLSVESVSEEFTPYGLAQLADPEPGSCGPLGGLLSSLQNLEPSCDWLLLVPCDAPFLPGDLAVRLKRCAIEAGQAGCVVRYQSELQPTFSIWNRSLLPALASAVMEQGMGGFKQFLGWRPLAILDWKASDISPFFNINAPGALAEAHRLIEQGSVN